MRTFPPLANGVQVRTVTSLEVAPRGCARVVVEDTWGVLAPVRAIDPRRLGTPWERLTEASLASAEPLGRVRWRRRRGRWEVGVVLYDFDRRPPTDEALVRATLAAVLAGALERGLEELALPGDYGVPHGGVPIARAAELVAAELHAWPRAGPARGLDVVLVVAPGEAGARLEEALDRALRTVH